LRCVTINLSFVLQSNAAALSQTEVPTNNHDDGGPGSGYR
jgi:hypothetical protein